MNRAYLLTAALLSIDAAAAFVHPQSVQPPTSTTSLEAHQRREFLSSAAAAIVGSTILPQYAAAELDTEDFLKTGMVSMPMGVSGQAGKAKPKTNVVLREGTDVLQSKKGDVTAEILLGKSSDPTPVLASFTSPWPLATGGLFDVECREASSGDGAFLTIAKGAPSSISDLPKTFFTENIFSPTGRFSFYGQPTDIKVKKSEVIDNRRYLEINFSNLSQSTNAEIPRTALVVATIPEGTDDVVMLVGSANASRWKKGSEKSVRSTVESFRVSLAPTSGLKVRAKQTNDSLL
mmetsp:Transcript_16415/g.23261  ORF Transcript_16415/g.23261 Transcript_16415/m.23261 type:complete len:291 (+) Transcript_16415:94-966(+)|eukprot:CAMPEP_0201694742 /NCGR_PEP_ID=MMETSP0578-20130828/6900_1 /ASSEMBLY_ACC=CAM_ASM_000663 /TAXON_ID=267565 /ORGANISM="Skeletonema grethea, Strain CCMP 1804" /LENGTH=290 /DNA_ID=CAMNT_0048180463 /DNA_START=65 /DNA_END=937 /DNA_ORIENTATION=-